MVEIYRVSNLSRTLGFLVPSVTLLIVLTIKSTLHMCVTGLEYVVVL